MLKKVNPAWLFSIVALAILPCFSNSLPIRLMPPVIGYIFDDIGIGYLPYILHSISTLIYLLAMIFFIILLFQDKYDTNMIIAIAAMGFLKILFSIDFVLRNYNLHWGTELYRIGIPDMIFKILFYIALIVFAVVSVIPKYEKTKAICQKIWYIPAILKFIGYVFGLSLTKAMEWGFIPRCIRLGDLIFYILKSEYGGIIRIAILISLIEVVAVLIFSYKLVHCKYPVKKERVKGASPEDDIGLQEGYCELWKHVLLLLFTFGIWQFIWVYRTTGCLNRTKGEEYRNPTTKLLLYMFVPFYSIYWIYKSAQRIDKMAKEKGVFSDLSTMCLILGIFIPIIALILMQDKINAIVTARGASQAAGASTSENSVPFGAADELKKYEELLDIGVITQEEFDAKKKQLLGL